MNREDYLKIRLQKDFYNYCILRADGKNAGEIADALEVTAKSALGGDILRSMQEKASSHMKALIDREFSLEKLKDGDSFLKKLPDGFGPELIDKVKGEYEAFLESAQMTDPEALVSKLLLRKIEKEAWRSGFCNFAEGIALFQKKTAQKAEEYRACAKPADYADELEEKYAKAGKSSLVNRLFSSNSDDIIEFRNCLREAASLECGNSLYNNVADFLKSIAANPLLTSLVTYYDGIRQAATAQAAALPELEPVPEYEAEYRRAVPVDFYSRNIEKVDSYKAFYMAVMYAFARYENALVSDGFLVDGEICMFTGNVRREPAVLLQDILSYLIDYVTGKQI